MEKDAILRIEQLSAAGCVLPETDFSKTALPKDVAIYDLEKYQATRNYFRGQYKTISIDEFLKYVTDQAKDYDPACFVDEEKMCANAIFNIGTKDEPGRADYKADLSLVQTLPYQALRQINNQTMSQIEAVEWFENWVHVLGALDAEYGSIELKKAFSAIRRIEIDESKKAEHETQNFVGKRSLMESISVTGKDESLPAFITFKCAPYLGFDERTFKLRVSIITARGELGINLSIVQLEKELQEIAEEFKKLVKDGLGEGIDVYLGSFTA